MALEDEFNTLAAAGRSREAVALIERHAAAGDPEALFGLATMRLHAIGGPRDLAEAHRLLATATERGGAEAHRLLATLHANGTGTPEDGGRARALLAPVAADREVAEQLAVAALPPPAAIAYQALSQEPLVIRIEGLLLAEECAYLVARAGPRLRPSIIVDPRTGAPARHPHRDSSGVAFGPCEEDLVVRRINRRIALASRTEVACGEPLHILAYDRGQQYRPHLDAVAGAANQRSWTMLLWLNDDYAGGETAFPIAGLTVRGAAGDALLFENVTRDGRPDPRTRHAGLPVTRGRKWLATRWIRQRPLAPFEIGSRPEGPAS